MAPAPRGAGLGGFGGWGGGEFRGVASILGHAGRALGHFIVSLLGLKRFYLLIFFQSFKAPPSHKGSV